jgi:hypothetical protein
MKNIKNIFKLFFLLTLVVFTSCDQNDYIAPEDFTDLSINMTSGASSARETEVNRFFSFMDMSAGAEHQEWRIPKGNFFLEGPIPNNLTNHDDYIINAGDTVSTDRTVHVLFKKGDTATAIQYYGVFRDSTSFRYPAYWDSTISENVEDTIKTIKVGNKWIAEHTFFLDVYDTVVAAPELRLMDGTIIDHVNTESMTFTFGDTLVFEDISNFLPENNARPDESRWRFHTLEENEDDWTYYAVDQQTRDGDMEKRLIDEQPLTRLGSFRPQLTATRARTERLKQSTDTYEVPMIVNIVPLTENLELVTTAPVVESDDDRILIPINYRLLVPTENVAIDFTVKIDGAEKEIASAAISNGNLNGERIGIIALTLATPLVPTDANKVVTVSYNGANVLSLDERPLQAFTDAAVTVYVPTPVVQQGEVTESSDDLILIKFDQEIDPATITASSNPTDGFVVTLNGNPFPINEISVDATDPKILKLKMNDKLYQNDVVTVEFTGANEIKSAGEGTLTVFAAKTVKPYFNYLISGDEGAMDDTLGDFWNIPTDNEGSITYGADPTDASNSVLSMVAAGTERLRILSGMVDFEAGKTYTLKYKQYVDGAMAGTGDKMWLWAPKIALTPNTSYATKDAWYEVTKTVTIADTNTNYLRIQINPGAGTVYFDDFVLYESSIRE